MDIQRVTAFVIIIFMIIRLVSQKKERQVNSPEFAFWLLFWLSSGVAIIFIKHIDALVESLGFEAKGINVLLYVSVVLLFYLIFRLRIQLAKMESDITKVVRDIAIRKGTPDEQDTQH
jgi:hypothetical protein